MTLSTGQRKAAIDYLVANCDCWKHSGDREVLNQMTDDKLVHLKTAAEREQSAIAVANAAVNGFTSGGKAYRVNPATGQWEQRRVTNSPTDRAQGDMTGSTCTENEDEESALPARTVAPERPPMRRPAPAPAAEAGEADTPLPEEEEEYVGNRRRRARSLDDWMRTAPVEVQNMVRTAREVEIREKDGIISQLLANVADPDRQAHRDRLIQRSLSDLKNDLAIMPKAPANLDDDGDARHVANRRVRRGPADNDLLVPQVIDWQRVKPGDDLVSVQQPAATTNAFDESDDGDEEYQEFLRRAPERVRQTLQNAAAVEAKEKRRIIDQLTANVHNDAQEARIRASLQRKSLADLKDMLLIAPPSQTRPVQNWFGAAGTSPSSAPVGNRGATADPNEDVLIPQVIDFKANSKLVS